MNEELNKAFEEAVQALEKQQEDYWNSLTKEQQLNAFCAVARRIRQGDLIDKGSYRYVLYQVFGFGPEAYMPAQMAGYLDLHNSIMYEEYDSKLLTAFCKQNNIEDHEKKISDFLI